MASVIRGEDNFDSKPYASFPIGVPFEIWDHFAPVLLPDNSGDIKFIKLTADDPYNDGLLINESISGSAPLVEATAEIAVGPLTGLPVHLINTEESVIRARGVSGELQFDQMQRITGEISGEARGNIPFGESRIGAFSSGNQTNTGATGTTSTNGSEIKFNSADSPNARASSTTDGETRSKNVSATYYMRIV